MKIAETMKLAGRRPRVSLSRAGRYFVLVLFVVFVPAYILSVSLLFLMGSLFIALLGYNILLARLSLGRLEAQLTAVPELFSGREQALEITIFNNKRWLPSNHFLVDLVAEDFHSKPTIQSRLKKKSASSLLVRITPQRRGRCTLNCLVLTSGHPFGLAQATAVLHLDREVIIYPALLAEEIDTPPAESRERGLVPTNSDDYQYLAAYQPGDDVRRIHWRKSTLTDKPVLKKDLVRAEIVEPKLLITDDCPHFERALSALATRFQQGGQLTGWSVLTANGVKKADSRQAMLTFLALASPVDDTALTEFEEEGYKPLYLSQIRL